MIACYVISLLHRCETYPDFQIPFIPYTDASMKGIGGALYQEQKGALRFVGFGSRNLVGAESKYHSSKLEFLAL